VTNQEEFWKLFRQVDLLDVEQIDHSLAKEIFVVFDSDYHPWHLKSELRHFFQAKPDKKQEYIQAIANDPELGIPKHLPILQP